MKRMLVHTLAAVALAGCASMSPEPSAATASKEMRMAFDITDAATQPLIVKLETIEITRKQLVDAGYTPRIVMAFRGNASFFTQTDMSLVKEADRADAAKIQGMIRRFKEASVVESVEQCNIPLASRKIQPQNLMHEVKLVPNGWIALAEYQKKGYAYIAP
jgi:intracellular sulfur oxidation DsrE/DsrF family protein